MRRKRHSKFKTLSRYNRAYMTPQELKSNAKSFYVYTDLDGTPVITTKIGINLGTKCFQSFNEAYNFWLEEIERKNPDTIILEVDTSTYYIKDDRNSISYAYRILKGKQVINEVANVYGSIPNEDTQIGTCGIAEIIGATYALRELQNYDFSQVIIRYDNKYVKQVASGIQLDVSEDSLGYIKEYIDEYKKIAINCPVSFHHVFSHVGDIAHDNVDKNARKTNAKVKKAILANN